MFQDDQLFPHLDVAGNVGFGLRMRRMPRAAIRAAVDDALALVGLDGFGDRSVDRLSGGEAKRVALARSLAPRPTVLLLDEPLTGLDRELHDRLALDLAALLRSTSTTAVIVTHDLDEATTIADRTDRPRPPTVADPLSSTPFVSRPHAPNPSSAARHERSQRRRTTRRVRSAGWRRQRCGSGSSGPG